VFAGLNSFAVLAVDDPLGLRRERRAVRQGELVDEASPLELRADLVVPPRLGVVVAGHVDHPPALTCGEAAKHVEEVAILRPRNRRRRAVLARGHLGDPQEVEEIAREHELDGPGVGFEALEERHTELNRDRGLVIHMDNMLLGPSFGRHEHIYGHLPPHRSSPFDVERRARARGHGPARVRRTR
jgi:hypothetical protein